MGNISETQSSNHQEVTFMTITQFPLSKLFVYLAFKKVEIL